MVRGRIMICDLGRRSCSNWRVRLAFNKAAYKSLFFNLSILLFGINLQVFAAPAGTSSAYQPPYTSPLRFDVLGDGVTLSPLLLDWDLSNENDLKISNVEFNDRSFMIGIYQANKLDPMLNSVLDEGAGKEWLMVARWPRPLLKIGNLEALSRSGQVLWHQELKDSDFVSWQNQQSEWKARLRAKKVSAQDIAKMPLMQVNVALRKFNEDVQPFWSLTEPFRFCLTTEPEDGFFTRMCTRLVEVVHTQNPEGKKQDKKDEVSFSGFPRVAQPARVIAFNENAKLKDSQQVKENAPVQFYAELNSGSTFEFISKVISFNLVEMTEVNASQVRLMAFGPKPNIAVRDIRDDRRGVLEKILGQPWAPTIGDFREYWDVVLPREKPVLYVAGKGGGLFREEFFDHKASPRTNTSVRERYDHYWNLCRRSKDLRESSEGHQGELDPKLVGDRR